MQNSRDSTVADIFQNLEVQVFSLQDDWKTFFCLFFILSNMVEIKMY